MFTRIASALLLASAVIGCDIVDEKEDWDTGEDTEETEETEPEGVAEGLWTAVDVQLDHDCGDDVETYTVEELGDWQLTMTGDDTFDFTATEDSVDAGGTLSCIIEGHLLVCNTDDFDDDGLNGEIFSYTAIRIYEVIEDDKGCLIDAHVDFDFVE